MTSTYYIILYYPKVLTVFPSLVEVNETFHYHHLCYYYYYHHHHHHDQPRHFARNACCIRELIL